MDAFVEFVAQYRPEFKDEIVAADEAEIDLLESLAGPLPGAYRLFLSTMGESMGDFEPCEAFFEIGGTIGTYNHAPWLKHRQYVLVAGDLGLTDWYYFMDRTRPHGADDCMIVRMPIDEGFPTEKSEPTFASLEEFLYYGAFESLRMSELKKRLHFELDTFNPKPLTAPAEGVCALAEEHGFRRVAPTPRCALYDRGEAALLLHQHPIEPIYSFRIHCDDSDELTRLKSAFEDLTGIRGR